MSEIFLTKGSDWKYEKEWRYLKYLNDANERCKDANNLDANLFWLPPKCIMGVILGCYKSKELEDKIVALRREDSTTWALTNPTSRCVYDALPINEKGDRDLTCPCTLLTLTLYHNKKCQANHRLLGFNHLHCPVQKQ